MTKSNKKIQFLLGLFTVLIILSIVILPLFSVPNSVACAALYPNNPLADLGYNPSIYNLYALRRSWVAGVINNEILNTSPSIYATGGFRLLKDIKPTFTNHTQVLFDSENKADEFLFLHSGMFAFDMYDFSNIAVGAKYSIKYFETNNDGDIFIYQFMKTSETNLRISILLNIKNNSIDNWDYEQRIDISYVDYDDIVYVQFPTFLKYDSSLEFASPTHSLPQYAFAEIEDKASGGFSFRDRLYSVCLVKINNLMPQCMANTFYFNNLVLSADFRSNTTSYYRGFYEGYDIGERRGWTEGALLGYESYQEFYDEWYDDFYNSGYREGYNNAMAEVDGDYSTAFSDGYDKAIADSKKFNFLSLMGAVVDAPINAIFGSGENSGMLNFEIFGVNLGGFMLSLFSFSIIILVVKLILGGK